MPGWPPSLTTNFPALTTTELSQIARGFEDEWFNIKFDGYRVSAAAFRTLRPGIGLDIQVINAYLRLLQNAYDNEEGNFFIFDAKAFDGNNLNAPEYCEGLRVFDSSMLAIVIPVQTIANSNHLSLIVICPVEHEIYYLDLMARNGENLLTKIREFLRYCFKLENPEGDFEKFFSDWKLCNVLTNAQQLNYADIGVLMCQYVYQLILGYKFNISENINYYRQKMAAELCSGTIILPNISLPARFV